MAPAERTGSTRPEKDWEQNIMVFCRLFSDCVPMNVCTLRKRELDSFGWNSCSGCTIGLVQTWIDPLIRQQTQGTDG